jgi:hypothetical protein
MRQAVAALGACVLASSLTAGGVTTGASAAGRLPEPNAWVRVAEAPGPRTSFGLVYAPSERAFVCLGGSMQMDPESDPKAKDSPYSELTLNLAGGVWENRFPQGKAGAWGEAVGPSKAPAFAGSYYAFKMKDTEGNVRPYLGAGYYNAMWTWGNAAYDTARGRVVVYWTLAHQTAEYDIAARQWSVTAAAADLPQSFRDGMLFGAMCYDPVNREVLGGQGEWAYADGKWRRLVLGSAFINGLRGKAEALARRAQTLATAARNRYYLAETADESRRRLDEVVRSLAADVTGLANDVKAGSTKGDAYEQRQCAWAIEALTAAARTSTKAETSVSARITPEAIHDLDAARVALDRTVLALAVAPPRRAHARMVYDPASKMIVLFGGDALDRLLGDTWLYDVTARRWEQARPALSPAPRSGYKLVALPKSGAVLLIDGYGYQATGEMWVYDAKANTWQLLRESGRSAAAPARDWFPPPAAASDDDLVVTFLRDQRGVLSTWAVRADPSRIDAEGTAKRGVPPLTETPYREPTEDPQWFEEHAPPADPAAEERVLADLPANTWVPRQAPNWPRIEYARSRCWGSCVLDTDRDELLHFGGGHGTYDGNDVLHYSIRANRFFITHRPEHTLNFAPNGIGIPACASYQGRPFMSCHTYKVYAYDPTLRKMVVCAQKTEDRVFTYDPSAGLWDLSLVTPFHRSGFEVSNYQTKCIGTPQGAVAWTRTGEGLWRVEAARLTWEKIPGTEKIPAPGWDEQGMAYDSKRDRLLLFSATWKGDLRAVDLKSGQTEVLHPEGGARGAAPSREAIYLPEWDAILLGARPAGEPSASAPASPAEQSRWLLYDCARNAWTDVALGGADPLGKGRFNVSLGLMYDPKRHLVWAMDILSRPSVLRLNLARP